jgi:hypothetical protein
MNVKRLTTSPSGKEESEQGVGEKRQPLISSLRDVTLIASVYLFFVSFVYRHLLLVGLGIPDIDSPSLNVSLVDAFEPFAVRWREVLTEAILIGIVYAWASFFVRTSREIFHRVALLVLGVGAFPILYHIASAGASDEARSILSGTVPSGNVPMSMSFRPDRVGEYAPVLIHAANNDEAYLLYRSSDSYFVLVHPERNPSVSFVYEIPKADVSHIRRSPNSGR